MAISGRSRTQLRARALAFPFLLIAAAGCASNAPPAIDEVVAAERAFAADCYVNGVKASFLKFSADDAVVLAPDPKNAHEVFSARPDAPPDPARPKLVWWPLYAGVSRSNDLGFTTGPYEVGGERKGFYFTVWRRAPSGDWKWIFDGGVDADATDAAAEGARTRASMVGDMLVGGSPAALNAVRALEGELAARAMSDAAAALRDRLAPDAWVNSRGASPGDSEANREAALAARPAKAGFSEIGATSSAAGDLVWTYGSVAGGEDLKTPYGYYARIWRMRRGRWAIIFDEIIPTN